MPRFYFTVDYDGVIYTDDSGELFATSESAEAHAAVVANELGRNSSDAICVSVVDEHGVELGRISNKFFKMREALTSSAMSERMH
jgi:hypothetical protein